MDHPVKYVLDNESPFQEGRCVVLRRGPVMIAVGITIGFAASLMVTRVIQNVLWGITPTDPLTMAVAVAALAAAAILACRIPARRALKIDPLAALRYE